jgi:LacI family transcriptional regulator
MNTKKVTLKMIAVEAGVSIGTVARAINNKDGINEETRRDILSVAEELKYRPNKLAGALARKKTLHIGAVFTQMSPDFLSQLSNGISGAAHELEDFGITVEVIKINTNDLEEEDASLRALDVSMFDGLIIGSGARATESLIDGYVKSGLPVITANTDAANSSRMLYVGSNSRQSGMMGAEILTMIMGYSGKAAILGDFTRATSFTERFGGFCEFIQLNYPNVQVYPCACASIDSNVIALRLIELLEKFPDISGVFCTRNTCTIGALEAVSKLSREDINIVGYDVTEKTAEAMRNNKINALIFQDPYQQGYKSVKLMASHLLEGYIPEKPFLFIENRIVLKSNLNIYCDASANLNI